MNDNTVSVKIGSRDYPLLLSTFGMQEIKRRFGDILGAIEKLTDEKETIFERLNLGIALVSILATQGARAHNFNNPQEPPIPELPEEIAGVVLTIADINRITPDIIRALNIGLGRTVFSMPAPEEDDNEKN